MTQFPHQRPGLGPLWTTGARPGAWTPGRLQLPSGALSEPAEALPDLLTPSFPGWPGPPLPAGCWPAGGQQGLPPRPSHSSSPAPSIPGSDCSSAPGRFRAVVPSSGVPPALFLSVPRECPPATLASLACNVPGAGAPCTPAPGHESAPPSPGVPLGRPVSPSPTGSRH